MEYNKLNIFYLALTEKECFRLPFELSFEWVLVEARSPASVWENEPALKHKSPQTICKLNIQEIIRIIS